MTQTIENSKSPEDTLKKGIEAVDNYHYVISAGTALGLHRDKDFIPNDTDIDVEILVGPQEMPPDIKNINGMELYVFNYDNGKPSQRAFKDANGLIFDIYFMYIETHRGMAGTRNEGRLYEVPAHFLQNRKKIATKYGTFYLPHPIEEYLAYRYGKDWREPKESKGIFAP